MLKKIVGIFPFLVGFFTISFGQQTVCLGDDATACVGEPITIEACGAGNVNQAYDLSNPASYPLGDDDFTGLIPLGFDFEFYGSTYNQVTIGDNGVLSFNVANANGFCPWQVETIPTNTAEIQNSILFPWQDLYNPHGGTIYYETIGTAPNRIGVIWFDGLSMFSSSCQTADQCFSGGILLFEGSNRIETHISNKTVCMSWGNGVATHGLNLDGTVAHPVPGRNNSVWTAQADAWEFVPTSPTDYDVNQIPYATVNVSNNSGVVWEDTEGNSYPFNNGELTTTVESGTVGYFVSSSTCGVGAGSVSDTTWITGVSVSAAVSGTDDECSQGIGEAVALGSGGTAPYTYQWNDPNNQTTQTATGLFSGTYTVTVTDATGCQGTATVTIGDTPISLSTSYTQVSCPGGSDGTATVDITPAPSSATYDWFDAGGQTTQTATGLSAGTYNVAVETDVGCQDTAEVIVDEIPGMMVDLVNSTDASCNSGSDGQATIEVTQGTAPYSYSWTGSSSTSESANDLAAGTHTVTVTDANGCVATFDVSIGEPSPLRIDNIAPDTTVCVGDSALLYAVGAGGSSPYTFTWKQNGSVVGVGDTIRVLPDADNSQYCVTLTEQCGSPQAEECLTVSHPDEISPMISPDRTGACHPVEVTFDNVTNTSQSIDYTVWDYGDGEVDTINGLGSATHEFDEGLFDISVEVVSQLGCNYFATYDDLIEGYPYPDAEFYVNPNPASVYEPEVDAFSQSGSDIISYEWMAEGANPEHSSLQNPTFEYPDEVENHDLILVVENSHGCKDTMTRIVRVQNEVQLFAPNSFTPDGDELNQNWRVYIEGIDVFNFDLFIFNRWGEIVWESHDPNATWDGTYGGRRVPEGTYVWKIRAFDKENDNKYEFNGFVNVIR